MTNLANTCKCKFLLLVHLKNLKSNVDVKRRREAGQTNPIHVKEEDGSDKMDLFRDLHSPSLHTVPTTQTPVSRL